MKRVLVVHPQFEVPGGAEQVSASIINWLLNTGIADVTLLTLLPVKSGDLARAGTSERCAGLVRNAVAKCPGFIRNSRSSFHLLGLAYLHRAARAISRDYDLCLSTYNELDFGKRGAQYVHHPSFADRSLLRELGMLGRVSILDRVPLAGVIYRRVAFMISGEKIAAFRKNLTLVNSQFMRETVRKAYGLDGIVVYPAVIPEEKAGSVREPKERELRFLSVGRIAPDKNFHRLIEHFAFLYRTYHQADFVIAGRSADVRYEEMLKEKARNLGLPLRIMKDLPDEEMESLYISSRYYVHAKVNEHFGISILKAASLGCLTFAHDSGAAREIVSIPDLLYRDSDDLLSKVTALESDHGLETRARSALQSGLGRFTLRKFNADLDAALLPILEIADRNEA